MSSPFPIIGGFPAAQVEASIREALRAEHDAQQMLRPRPSSACEPEVNSLVVIEIICAIEELLGVSLPTSFAPHGGYEDVETCVSDLLSEARGVWTEHVKLAEKQNV